MQMPSSRPLQRTETGGARLPDIPALEGRPVQRSMSCFPFAFRSIDDDRGWKWR